MIRSSPRYLLAVIPLVLAMACGELQPALSAPTAVPPTPTGSPCPFVANPGPPPPEVEKRAQDAFQAMAESGIRGKLRVQAYGEYSCDKFGVQAVDFEYTLVVPDLQDQATIQEQVARVKQSAKESVQGWNLGQVSVRFVSGQECFWDENQNACIDTRPLISNPFP